MEENKDKALSLEKTKVMLLAAVLAVLVIFTVAVGVMLVQIRSYAASAGQVIDRLNQVTAALEDLDTERMVATANQVTEALDKAKIDEMAESLSQVAAQLAQVDWESLGTNINALAIQAQESLATAEKELIKAGEVIDEMDIAALNQAVKDLQAAVEPLAKLANLFK